MECVLLLMRKLRSREDSESCERTHVHSKTREPGFEPGSVFRGTGALETSVTHDKMPQLCGKTVYVK